MPRTSAGARAAGVSLDHVQAGLNAFEPVGGRSRALSVPLPRGTVTLVDPSQMQSNVNELDTLEQIEMLGVQLHLLPAGHRYSVTSVSQTDSVKALRQAIQRLVAVGPMRG